MTHKKLAGRPTRPSDWLLLGVMTAHNMAYVVTTALEGAVTLVDNMVHQRDREEEAWQEFTLDMETLKEDEDASRRLPEA